MLISFYEKDLSVKDEVKKSVETALRKVEREMKSAKEEASNFKSKADDLEQKLTRVPKKLFFFSKIIDFHPSLLGIQQAEMDKKGLNERIQRQEVEWRKERDQLIGRATDLEVEIKVL